MDKLHENSYISKNLSWYLRPNIVPRQRFLDRHWAYLLSHAAHAVSQSWVQDLRARDVSVAQWRVLASLYDDAPSTVQQLAQRTLYRQTTLTKLIDRMAELGWVTRTASPFDGRERHLVLTAAGQELALELVQRAKVAEKKALSLLSAQERKTLSALLAKLTEVN
jgi:DNA-binding MarR family transcriptional regulator